MPRWDASDVFDGWLYVPDVDPLVVGTYVKTHFARAPGQSGDYNIIKAEYNHAGEILPLVVGVPRRGAYNIG